MRPLVLIAWLGLGACFGTDQLRYLVNAKSPAGALRTAVMHLGGNVRYAEQTDIYLLASNGAKVLEEGDQPQGDLPLE